MFARVFQRKPFADSTPRIHEALMEMGKEGGIMDARDDLSGGPAALLPELTEDRQELAEDNQGTAAAGMTFFGQFLNHDITHERTSRLGTPAELAGTPNVHSPTFNLEHVYGRRSGAAELLREHGDSAKLRVESGGLFEDVPRSPDGAAQIGDFRNDENVITSGLHAAFLLFHNRVVDHLRARGVTAFTEFRRTVTWHYQWIILHEYLPRLISHSVVDHILNDGRKFYRPPDTGLVPVEFQISFRAGHSTVRPSYRVNLCGDAGGPFIAMLFEQSPPRTPDDPSDLRGGARAPRRFIDWENFFEFDVRKPANPGFGTTLSKRISTKISTPLFHLPLASIPSHDAPTALPQRNLLRHLTWSIPSGQQIAAAMGVPPLTANDFSELTHLGVGLERSTPLWYYILKEAELICDGLRLGPVGASLVGETIIGLLQMAPESYLVVNPHWKPTLPAERSGEFTMADLLTFAMVDPVSRAKSGTCPASRGR